MKIAYRVTLIIAFCALGLGLAACMETQIAQQPNLVRETPTIQLPLSITDLQVGQAPNYQGITPGISHKNDVLAQWGEPNVTRGFQSFESLHYFNGFAQESFLIKNDVVQAVTSNVLGKQLARDGYSATTEAISQVLGLPTVITPTVLGDPIWAFPKYGLALSGSTAQLFEPMNLQEYQDLWGKLPLGYDPFPLIAGVEDAGIKPGVTTRSEVMQLLGTPDRIVHQDRDTPWWYFVEPDMLGRLHIFFSADDRVESMSIAPFYQSPQPLLLGDVVKHYGPPELLELTLGPDGSNYERQSLVYLERGLRVSAACSTQDCKVVRRTAPVVEKYYFQPKTLEQYKSEFHGENTAHEPAYIEWRGFDE
jgi:hypothetical protein